MKSGYKTESVITESLYEYATRKKLDLIEISDPSKLLIPIVDRARQKQEFTAISNAHMFAVKIPKGKVVRGDYILTDDNRLLVDGFSYNSYAVSLPEIDPGGYGPGRKLVETPAFFELNIDKDTTSIEGGVYIGGGMKGYFGHWFFEYMPRFFSLGTLPEVAQVHVSQDLPKYFLELVDIARLVGASYSKVNLSTTIEFKDVWFISCPVSRAPKTMQFRVWLDGIRQQKRHLHDLTGLAYNQGESVYGNQDVLWIPRKTAKWRKILNSEDVFRLIAKYFGNTQEVVIDQLPLAEQLKKIQSAKLIVTEAGSGSSFNIFMSKPGTVIIEITPPAATGTIHKIFSSIAGVFFSKSQGLQCVGYEVASGPHPLDKNYIADLIDLENLLQSYVKYFEKISSGSRSSLDNFVLESYLR